jgi:transcriptional regulator GlxA family with amidase domain
MAPDLHADSPTQRDYKQRLLRVLVYIQQNLDGPLELEELARVACFSPYHFHRIFTGMIGESVKAHIRRLRGVSRNLCKWFFCLLLAPIGRAPGPAQWGD